MATLSIVILTQNEEAHIASCIESAKLVTDDIIVVDSESSDNTLYLAKRLGARCFSIKWNGYGEARNFGAQKAKYDWILALDADEQIGNTLARSINRISFTQINCVYQFKRENYLGKERIRFGALGFDTVKRIYNRLHTQWNLAIVHEKLASSYNTNYKFLAGTVVHYGFKDFEEYKAKLLMYARLSAQKYFIEGRRTNLLKKLSSAFFNSFKSYFLQLGFLDGLKGFKIARAIGRYSWLKYSHLQQIYSKTKSNTTYAAKSKIEIASN